MLFFNCSFSRTGQTLRLKSSGSKGSETVAHDLQRLPSLRIVFPELHKRMVPREVVVLLDPFATIFRKALRQVPVSVVFHLAFKELVFSREKEKWRIEPPCTGSERGSALGARNQLLPSRNLMPSELGHNGAHVDFHSYAHSRF